MYLMFYAVSGGYTAQFSQEGSGVPCLTVERSKIKEALDFAMAVEGRGKGSGRQVCRVKALIIEGQKIDVGALQTAFDLL